MASVENQETFTPEEIEESLAIAERAVRNSCDYSPDAKYYSENSMVIFRRVFRAALYHKKAPSEVDEGASLK